MGLAAADTLPGGPLKLLCNPSAELAPSTSAPSFVAPPHHSEESLGVYPSCTVAVQPACLPFRTGKPKLRQPCAPREHQLGGRGRPATRRPASLSITLAPGPALLLAGGGQAAGDTDLLEHLKQTQ